MIEATKATMQKRHTDREAYFHELAQTCERYFMPYILRQVAIASIKTLLVFAHIDTLQFHLLSHRVSYAKGKSVR